LKENNLENNVSGIVLDRDSSTNSILKSDPELIHIKLYHDIGHKKRELLSKLKSILGKKDDDI